MADRKKYVSYYNYDINRPWYIIIIDIEWWESDILEISKWLERNCSKSVPGTNMVINLSNEEYSMWQLAWG